MSKQQWLQAHEDLVAEFLEMNPGVSWSLAYELTAKHVDDRVADNYAAQIDHWRSMQKDQE